MLGLRLGLGFMFGMFLPNLLVTAFSSCVTVKLQVADDQGFKYEGPQADLTSVATAFYFLIY